MSFQMLKSYIANIMFLYNWRYLGYLLKVTSVIGILQTSVNILFKILNEMIFVAFFIFSLVCQMCCLQILSLSLSCPPVCPIYSLLQPPS